MLDLFLYLGKQPMSQVPEGKTYSDSDVYYGKFVQDLIDIESEAIKELLKLNSDLVI
jgi:hypothetical protein